MTMNEATAEAARIPEDKRNNNCVIDAQWRLLDVIKLAQLFYGPEDTAPAYVQKRVDDLKSWF